jgi:hypothetical protein
MVYCTWQVGGARLQSVRESESKADSVLHVRAISRKSIGHSRVKSNDEECFVVVTLLMMRGPGMKRGDVTAFGNTGALEPEAEMFSTF